MGELRRRHTKTKMGCGTMWQHNDGKATVDVTVTTDEWNVGGRTYHEGDKLTIRASTLAAHVEAGRCVPSDKYEEFMKIRAMQARAAEQSRKLAADAEKSAKEAEENAVRDAVNDAEKKGEDAKKE